MDSKMFVQADRKQAGVYFETIFNAMDKIEVQDAAFAGKEKRPVKTLLDMGHMMAWAASEVRTATFPGGDVPANDWRATELHMELNIALFEEYLGMAYQKYEEYQEAQARAQEASWLGLKWF